MRYKKIVEKGFEYSTKSPLTYTQAELVEKFKQLNVQVAKPTVSIIYLKLSTLNLKIMTM